jgi:hypothetical protein
MEVQGNTLFLGALISDSSGQSTWLTATGPGWHLFEHLDGLYRRYGSRAHLQSDNEYPQTGL